MTSVNQAVQVTVKIRGVRLGSVQAIVTTSRVPFNHQPFVKSLKFNDRCHPLRGTVALWKLFREA